MDYEGDRTIREVDYYREYTVQLGSDLNWTEITHTTTGREELLCMKQA